MCRFAGMVWNGAGGDEGVAARVAYQLCSLVDKYFVSYPAVGLMASCAASVGTKM